MALKLSFSRIAALAMWANILEIQQKCLINYKGSSRNSCKVVMKVLILHLQKEGRHILINRLKEIKCKVLKIRIKVLTVVYSIFKN